MSGIRDAIVRASITMKSGKWNQFEDHQTNSPYQLYITKADPILDLNIHEETTLTAVKFKRDKHINPHKNEPATARLEERDEMMCPNIP